MLQICNKIICHAISFIYFLFVIFSPAIGFAQKPKTDSLWRSFYAQKMDSTKVKLLNELSKNYKNNQQTDSIPLAATQARLLAEKIKFDTGLALALIDLAAYYKSANVFDSAIFYYQKAIALRKKYADNKDIAFAYQGLGNTYYDMAAMPLAMQTLTQAKELLDKTNPAHKVTYGTVSANLARVYTIQSNYDKAIENLLQSIQIKEELKDTKGLASSYLTLAIVYSDQNDLKKELEYKKNH